MAATVEIITGSVSNVHDRLAEIVESNVHVNIIATEVVEKTKQSGFQGVVTYKTSKISMVVKYHNGPPPKPTPKKPPIRRISEDGRINEAGS